MKTHTEHFEETLTKEEKETKSYLDWSDERLGQFCRALSKDLPQKKVEGFNGVVTMASTIMLIDAAKSSNAGTLKLLISQYTNPKSDINTPEDWEIIVRKKKQKITNP